MNKLRIYKLTGLFLLLAISLCPILSGAEAENKRQVVIQLHHSTLLTFQTPIIRAAIADPKIADVKVLTPTQLLVVATAKSSASTTLILWLNDQKVKVVDVVIYTAIPSWILSSLEERIAVLAPGVDIQVSPSTQPEEQQLILSGTVPCMDTLNQVKTIVESFNIKFVNLVQVTGPQQVQLKVVIAEVSKSGLKQMGLSFLKLSDRMSGMFAKGGGFSFENQKNSAALQLQAEIPSPFTSAFNLALLSAESNWGGILSLLKNQGLARTLATPTLVTMNGQKAEFQVGGSYPVPVAANGGGTGTEDKEYGIILKFTPYILGDDTITLEVMPEVSAPDFSLGIVIEGASIPGLIMRKASTTLQLKTGQTFAMAGLLKDEFYNTVNKVPFLGDIPYIGSAFTSKEIKHSETELVIMVTPTIVRPMDPTDVPDLPGSRMKTQMSDTDFFIKNRSTEPPGSDKDQGTTPGFKGKTGFVK